MKKLFLVTVSAEVVVRAETESEAEEYAKRHTREMVDEFEYEAEEISEPRFVPKAYGDSLPWRSRQDDGGMALFGHELTCDGHFVREQPEDPRQGSLLELEPRDPDCDDCDGRDFWHLVECPRAERLLKPNPAG